VEGTVFGTVSRRLWRLIRRAHGYDDNGRLLAAILADFHHALRRVPHRNSIISIHQPVEKPARRQRRRLTYSADTRAHRLPLRSERRPRAPSRPPSAALAPGAGRIRDLAFTRGQKVLPTAIAACTVKQLAIDPVFTPSSWHHLVK